MTDKNAKGRRDFRKILLLVFGTLYSFFLIGFAFHTSAIPTIFDKYTDKYFIFLLLLYLLFLPILFIINFLFHNSIFIVKKKKYKITPLIKFILVFVLFLFLFVCLEVFLREKFPNRENIYGKRIENFDPYLQNKLTKYDNLHINSSGFRGEEISQNKKDDVYRIFFLGGSTVLSPFVDFEKSSPRLIEKMLSEKYDNTKIEVLNAGNDWYTTKHSLIQYLFKIKDFKPDLIIMWHGINDVVRSCTPEFFSYGTYISDYSHFYGAFAGIVNDRFIKKPFIVFDSHAIEFINHNLKSNFFSDLKKATKKEAINIKYGGSNFSNFPSINAYERNLKSTIQILKNDKIEVLVGNQAFLFNKNLTPEEISNLWLIKSFCGREGVYPDITSSIIVLDNFNQIARKVSTDENVSFVDLESKIPKNLNYFTDDVHTNDKGDEIIAKEIFNYIVNANYIK